MPVLVDGNNLLFAARDADPERPLGRAKLCELLGRWAGRADERVAVVFDGPQPATELAQQIAGRDVSVEYSGPVKADEVIAVRLAGESAPRRLVVVSTDREVARAARRRRARPIRSDAFWEIVLADLRRESNVPLEPLEKRIGLRPGQSDEWVRELGLEGETGGDEFPW